MASIELISEVDLYCKSTLSEVAFIEGWPYYVVGVVLMIDGFHWTISSGTDMIMALYRSSQSRSLLELQVVYCCYFRQLHPHFLPLRPPPAEQPRHSTHHDNDNKCQAPKYGHRNCYGNYRKGLCTATEGVRFNIRMVEEKGRGLD